MDNEPGAGSLHWPERPQECYHYYKEMKNIPWIIAGLLLILTAGCGSFKTYRLPVGVANARATFPAIKYVAQSMSLQVAEFGDAVHVRLDETAWVYYSIQNDEYNMVLHIDDDLGDSGRETKFSDVKLRAEEIWNAAMEIKGFSPPPSCALIIR
jgi:hypothetical protein